MSSIEPKYRSRLEVKIASQLTAAGAEFAYEPKKVRYTVPAREAKYTYDFGFPNCPMVLEAKGYLRPEDRKKLVNVKASNPDLDIRIVFQRASNPIRKGSPTTYAMWADKEGFPWADNGVIPEAWLAEIKPK